MGLKKVVPDLDELLSYLINYDYPSSFIYKCKEVVNESTISIQEVVLQLLQTWTFDIDSGKF